MTQPNDLRATGVTVTALTAALGTGLAVLSPATWSSATAPHASAAELLALVALGAGWLLTTRLLAATLGTVLGLLPGAVGRVGRAIAHRCTPILVRRLVHGVVGAAVAAGPLATGAASWAAEPKGGLPILDRVASVPAAAPAAVPAAPPAAVPAAVPGQSGTAALPVVSAPASSPTLLPSAAQVRVRPGDSLWRIAAEHLPAGHTDADVARAWPRWYTANRATIGPDPAVLTPGQQLVVPTGAAS